MRELVTIMWTSSRYIEVDSRALTAIETVLKQASIPYQEVMTWSTDGFYRETPDKVAYRMEVRV